MHCIHTLNVARCIEIQMGKSNAYAGYVEAAQGISTLVVALPAGWAADRGSKSRIVRLAGFVVPLAIAISAFAVCYGVDHEERSERALTFTAMVVSLCLWGGVQAVQNGPAQALYADSTRAGERSQYYNISFSISMLASTLGPVVTIVIFALHGNDWSLPILRNTFLAGVALE
eukprot:5664913-Prymnesium_polylepis.2